MRSTIYRCVAMMCTGVLISVDAIAEEHENVLLASREVEVRLALETLAVDERTAAYEWASTPVFVETVAKYSEPRTLPRSRGVTLEPAAAAYGWQYASATHRWMFDCSSTQAQHVEVTYWDPGDNHLKVASYSMLDEYGPAGRIFLVQPDTTLAVIRHRACEAAEQHSARLGR